MRLECFVYGLYTVRLKVLNFVSISKLRPKATNRSPSGAADPSCPKSLPRTHWVECVSSVGPGPYQRRYNYCPLLPWVCPANPCHLVWGLRSPGWPGGLRSSGHWCPLVLGDGPEYWKCSAFGCGDHRLMSTGRLAPHREGESKCCSQGSPLGGRCQSRACPVCLGAAGEGQGQGGERAVTGGEEK